jgi:Flp pilus assembly protein protease CpaA
MYTGLLHLHSLLRWVILILLIVCIIKTFSNDKSIKVSKFLLIAAHITLLLGLYQYFFGSMGFKLFQVNGSQVMKNANLRFWAVEHITGMIAAITLITIGHISLKKTGNTKKSAILFTIALIIILAVVPWPFREVGIGKTWFPGMH